MTRRFERDTRCGGDAARPDTRRSQRRRTASTACAALAALAALAITACAGGKAPAPAPPLPIASATPAAPPPAVPPAVGAEAGAATHPGRVLEARLPFGAGALALGRSEGPEQNPTAPMAIAGDSSGRLWILDQDNGRVLAVETVAAAPARPRLLRTLPLALRYAEDLALDERGAPGARSVDQVWVLSRIADGVVVALDASTGRERARFGVRGDFGPAMQPDAAPGPSGLAFGGGITALLLHDGGVWVEWAHERSHRLGALDGSAAGVGAVLAGRPGWAGDLGLAAQRAGHGVIVTGRALGARAGAPGLADAPPIYRAEATFALPVLALRGLGGDPFGRVWVAVHTLRDDDAGVIVAEGLEVVRFGRDGAVEVRDAATPELGPHEQLRTFAIGAEGSLWHLARRDDHAIVERWAP